MARILHVDDDPAWRRLTEKWLPAHEITSVAYLAEGQQAVAAEPPDVIVLDLNLPDSVAFTTLERMLQTIRQQQQVIAVLVVAGAYQAESGNEFLVRAVSKDQIQADPPLYQRLVGALLSEKQEVEARIAQPDDARAVDPACAPEEP